MKNLLDKYQKLILFIAFPFPWLYIFVIESKWYSPVKALLIPYYMWLYIIGAIFYFLIPMMIFFFLGYLLLSITDFFNLTDYFNGEGI